MVSDHCVAFVDNCDAMPRGPTSLPSRGVMVGSRIRSCCAPPSISDRESLQRVGCNRTRRRHRRPLCSAQGGPGKRPSVILFVSPAYRLWRSWGYSYLRWVELERSPSGPPISPGRRMLEYSTFAIHRRNIEDISIGPLLLPLQFGVAPTQSSSSGGRGELFQIYLMQIWMMAAVSPLRVSAPPSHSLMAMVDLPFALVA